ncbi:MAG: type II 3-dehydroquinate dehydratase [Candidatus Omnitrophica bacterium]|nr:type II 3-dehydroquinate dehydratase [Candidatus Omnitrophota bacterium]
MKKKTQSRKSSSFPKRKKILIIHGPNLDLLGTREPEIYGKLSISDINRQLQEKAKQLGVGLEIIQSNHEGDIVDLIGKASGRGIQGILINPAAYTHTSVAIRDAISAVSVPAVEVHLSNIYKREPFRHVSLTASVCVGQVSGFGLDSYLLGLEALTKCLNDNFGGRNES